MSFRGYCRRAGRSGWSIVPPGLVLVVWIILAFGPLPAVTRDGLWGLWFVIAGWDTLRVTGPRALRWGTGQVRSDHSVTWNEAESFSGPLVHYGHVIPIASGWGPRVVLPGVILCAMWQYHPAVMGQPITQALIALVVLFAWQAWLQPIYRTVLTVDTPSGRRKIYVVRLEAPDATHL